jgi:hypothetical protein
MNYWHLPLYCTCGEAPEHIAEVGFTDDHQLVIHWWCVVCHRVVYVIKPLTDCWRESSRRAYPTPRQETPAELPYGEEDTRFLQRLGVKAQ